MILTDLDLFKAKFKEELYSKETESEFWTWVAGLNEAKARKFIGDRIEAKAVKTDNFSLAGIEEAKRLRKVKKDKVDKA